MEQLHIQVGAASAIRPERKSPVDPRHAQWVANEDDELNWSDEEWRSRGYDRPDPLSASTAQGYLRQLFEDDDETTDQMLRRARLEVQELATEALSEERRQLGSGPRTSECLGPRRASGKRS